MGYTTYNFMSRSVRSQTYQQQSFNDTFEQVRKREIHDSMKPFNLTSREARDSEAHPNSVPIILGLDLTGSMQFIPQHLIQEGLPKLVSNIMEHGCKDPQILFLGVGDHKFDKYPIQVSQFESGDEELDMWLTRTYPEGGGGSNGGESYLLAWYVGAYYTSTDNFEKRGKKGFLFTIGDEPCHVSLPKSFIQSTFNHSIEKGSLKIEELYEDVCKKYHVFHINLGYGGNLQYLLGEGFISVPRSDYHTIPTIIANKISEFLESETPVVSKPTDSGSSVNNPIML